MFHLEYRNEMNLRILLLYDFILQDVVGDIYQVQEHFSAEHDPSTFKVKRVQVK